MRICKTVIPKGALDSVLWGCPISVSSISLQFACFFEKDPPLLRVLFSYNKCKAVPFSPVLRKSSRPCPDWEFVSRREILPMHFVTLIRLFTSEIQLVLQLNNLGSLHLPAAIFSKTITLPWGMFSAIFPIDSSTIYHMDIGQNYKAHICLPNSTVIPY